MMYSFARIACIAYILAFQQLTAMEFEKEQFFSQFNTPFDLFDSHNQQQKLTENMEFEKKEWFFPKSNMLTRLFNKADHWRESAEDFSRFKGVWYINGEPDSRDLEPLSEVELKDLTETIKQLKELQSLKDNFVNIIWYHCEGSAAEAQNNISEAIQKLPQSASSKIKDLWEIYLAECLVPTLDPATEKDFNSLKKWRGLIYDLVQNQMTETIQLEIDKLTRRFSNSQLDLVKLHNLEY